LGPTREKNSFTPLGGSLYPSGNVRLKIVSRRVAEKKHRGDDARRYKGYQKDRRQPLTIGLRR